MRIALVVAVFAACVVAALLLRGLTHDDDTVPVIPTPPGATRGQAVSDPFAWTPKRSADLSKRAIWRIASFVGSSLIDAPETLPKVATIAKCHCAETES